jgi:hypothetical protein
MDSCISVTEQNYFPSNFVSPMKFTLAATALLAMVVATAAAPAPADTNCFPVCFAAKPQCPSGWIAAQKEDCWTCCH